MPSEQRSEPDWGRLMLETVSCFLASSLDFLQGTFEKIQLHRLLGQYALQIANLFPKFSYRGVHSCAVLARRQIPPLVQHPINSNRRSHSRFEFWRTTGFGTSSGTRLDAGGALG
jgi:hypothetical protein